MGDRMTGLVRLPDWRRRYAAAITEIKAKPFDWQHHECATGLAGRIVRELTGIDLAAQFAGDYDDAESAARYLLSLGFSNLGDLVATLLPEIHPSAARIGDIALIESDGLLGGLGVVNGERIYVLTAHGFGTVDLLDAKRAFKVG